MIQNLRNIKRKFNIARKVNWVKTLYFNFKMFPFSIAKKLPVFFYGSVKFTSLKGSIIIDAPLKTAMIGFGQPYEMNTRSCGIAELFLEGNMIFKGHVAFSKDVFLYIKQDADFEIGHLSSIATRSKIICTHKISLGSFVQCGSETQFIDTNFHSMINTQTGVRYPMSAPIDISDYVYIGSRVMIMKHTVIPSYFTIASNSLTNKNYTSLGRNTLIGGLPAKLIKENISRDWEGERESLEKNLIINF
jgi:acetyltransferase-like isoleucine patch superfamily enzyme